MSAATGDRHGDDTRELLRRIDAGDLSARDALYCRHRARLRRMIEMRMDQRSRARFDPSDVVQESLLIASERISTYVRDPKIPLYPWLRRIAWEQLVKFHERHVETKKRTVVREEGMPRRIDDESVGMLAERIAGREQSPSECIASRERRQAVREALRSLEPRDREIIELRYLEQMDNSEISSVLGISRGAARTRHFRAIQRLSQALQAADQS
jgi:RNA polymerase sigma-70 factor (ECF subfamily)